MKKPLFFFIFSFILIQVNAQDIVITFSSTNKNEEIDSVLVENLVQGKSIHVLGNTLELTESPVIAIPISDEPYSCIEVYPNPASDFCYLQLWINKQEPVAIYLFDLAGRGLISYTGIFEEGNHKFELAGLPTGLSILKIVTPDINYSGKLMNVDKRNSKLSFKHSNILPGRELSMQLKDVSVKNVQMQYNDGESLKYTIYSAGNATVVIDVPTDNKTVSVSFIDTRDKSGISYATVQIGNQTWFAENLKTTKYNDGTPIPLIVEKEAWYNLTGPGYCWYNNDESNKNKYGALYNWHAVNTGKICPEGWCVPSTDDWNILTNYLISNGYNYDNTSTQNKIAKSLAAAFAWNNAEVEGTPGSTDNPKKQNSSGFSAIPAGYRWYQGDFYSAGYVGLWWSSVSKNCIGIANNLSEFKSTNEFFTSSNNEGFSVRCIKGEPSTGIIYGSFTDKRDGHVYKTVGIGTQTWMAENLCYLPKITSSSEYSPHYLSIDTVSCFYVYGYHGININEAISSECYKNYGALYNWNAAQKVCPGGWHLPSDEEWRILSEYLGGDSVAGEKLKSVEGWDLGHCYFPTRSNSNYSGFSALPGGGIWFMIYYSFQAQNDGLWWSSSDYSLSPANASYRLLTCSSPDFFKRIGLKAYGHSIRCIKD